MNLFSNQHEDLKEVIDIGNAWTTNWPKVKDNNRCYACGRYEPDNVRLREINVCPKNISVELWQQDKSLGMKFIIGLPCLEKLKMVVNKKETRD